MKRFCLVIFLFLLITPHLLAAQSEIPILNDPVYVGLIPKAKEAEDLVLLVKIKYKSQNFILDAGWEGSRLDYQLDEFKRRTRWKDKYLFIAESCGGCNAFRGERDRVYKIKSGRLELVGIIQGRYDESRGDNYKNGLFLDCYDKFEINRLTSHALGPSFYLVLKDVDDHLSVDLDQTWLWNKSDYQDNLKIIHRRIDKKVLKPVDRFVNGFPAEGDDVVTSALLTNGLLCKYCKRDDEYLGNLQSAKKFFTKTYLKEALNIFAEVVPGEEMKFGDEH